MSVLAACVFVYRVHILPIEAKRGLNSLGTGVTGSLNHRVGAGT